MKEQPKRHVCPFCEDEIAEAAYPFCQTCRITLQKCSACGKPLAKDTTRCPACGASIKPEPNRKQEIS